MTELFVIFVVLNITNVVLTTIKSLVTIKGGAFLAATMNAITFFVYTYVVIYTSADGMSMLTKATITAVCNFVGVFVVKFIEAKSRKDKLWKVEATVSPDLADGVIAALKNAEIPHNYIDVNKYMIFNIYCATQNESEKVKKILDQYDAKYFVSETKTL